MPAQGLHHASLTGTACCATGPAAAWRRGYGGARASGRRGRPGGRGRRACSWRTTAEIRRRPRDTVASRERDGDRSCTAPGLLFAHQIRLGGLLRQRALNDALGGPLLEDGGPVFCAKRIEESHVSISPTVPPYLIRLQLPWLCCTGTQSCAMGCQSRNAPARTRSLSDPSPWPEGPASERREGRLAVPRAASRARTTTSYIDAVTPHLQSCFRRG